MQLVVPVGGGKPNLVNLSISTGRLADLEASDRASVGAALLAEQSLRELREQLQRSEEASAAELSQELFQVRGHFKQSEQDNLTLSSDLLSVQTQLENSSADLTQLTVQHQELEDENSELQAKLQESQEANLTYSTELTHLTEKLSSFSEEKAQLELFLQGQVNAAVEEIEQMRQVTATQQELFDLTQKQLTDAIQERSNSSAEVQHLMAQLERLER